MGFRCQENALSDNEKFLREKPMTARIPPDWMTPDTSLNNARLPIETVNPVNYEVQRTCFARWPIRYVELIEKRKTKTKTMMEIKSMKTNSVPKSKLVAAQLDNQSIIPSKVKLT